MNLLENSNARQTSKIAPTLVRMDPDPDEMFDLPSDQVRAFETYLNPFTSRKWGLTRHFQVYKCTYSTISENQRTAKGGSRERMTLQGKKYFFIEKGWTKEITKYLLTRGYREGVVKEQIRNAKSKSRRKALTPRHRTDNKRIPMVVTYHPGLPNINWRNPDCSFPETDESSGLSRSLKTETATTWK